MLPHSWLVPLYFPIVCPIVPIELFVHLEVAGSAEVANAEIRRSRLVGEDIDDAAVAGLQVSVMMEVPYSLDGPSRQGLVDVAVCKGQQTLVEDRGVQRIGEEQSTTSEMGLGSHAHCICKLHYSSSSSWYLMDSRHPFPRSFHDEFVAVEDWDKVGVEASAADVVVPSVAYPSWHTAFGTGIVKRQPLLCELV